MGCTMLGMSLRDQIPSEQFWKRSVVEDVIERITSLKLKGASHLQELKTTVEPRG